MEENDPLDPTWSQSYHVMAPFTPKPTSKLRSPMHFEYSIVIPAPILLNSNNHYNHGFHNTFDYINLFIYSDYLLCTVTARSHIIRQ